MTDTSFPLVKPVNGPDLLHASLTPAFAAFAHQRYPPAVVDGVQEDDGQIHCVCGYTDDDGLTVACDVCNRWQHIVCYYPHYENSSVPDDLQHFCVECKPHPIDVDKARSKQRARREHAESLSNGNKRNAAKGQKKKTKELSMPYMNGWPLDKNRHDRNSASPRDAPPPAKRPKTSHRTSDSTTVTTSNIKNHSRKRNLSNVHQARSASRSPDAPFSLYSNEFLQCCFDDNWEVTNANLHNSISITNSLSAWLNASEDDFKDEHGHDKSAVLMRWNRELHQIPGRAEIEIRTDRDDAVQYNGQYPSWKVVTVKEPIPDGAYIGELKGHIGFKREYQEDPANRWSQLRHPEPFVFFHPKLPIVIDARNEGTELRYIRRSCAPNARLQILITNSNDYHFCIMATQQIDPGVEVALSWDTADGLRDLESRNRNNVSTEDLESLSSWVSTVLANCGPCACQLSESDECMMSRFDRRARDPMEEQHLVKSNKVKRRKNGIQMSPLDTLNIHSRSGSEIRKVEQEDEPTDSRSASGSAGRGSASRDMTPNTHYSANGATGNITELSERERKKLAKEEEMFRRQEEERTNKIGKKKRNSGGSNANTPSASSSNTSSLTQMSGKKSSLYVRTNSRQAGSLPAKGSQQSRAQKSTLKPTSKASKRPKPVYIEASTQCNMDEEEAAAVAARTAPPVSRKQFISHRQKLLERAARNNALMYAARTVIQSSPSVSSKDEKMTGMEQSVSPSTLPGPSTVSTTEPESPTAVTASGTDVEMQDAAFDEDVKQTVQLENHASSDGQDVSAEQVAPQVVEPSAPPWPIKQSSTPELVPQTHDQKAVDMHVEIPPLQANPFTLQTTPILTDTPGNTTLMQSPASLVGPHSIFPPSVTAAVTPGSTRKISLSDWTRRKTNNKDNEAKVERESSPASTASGPVVPPLQPSNSCEANAAEGGSAIEEDVKMEDAGDKS